MKFGGETLNRFFLTKKGLPSALEVPCFAFVVLRKQFNFQSAVKRSMIFLFFFVMVVANCNASCDWLYVRCSQWELLLFFHLDSSLYQYGRFHAVSFETASRDAQTLNLPRNVSKFNAQQVVSLMNEQQSQKLLFKVEPLSPT